MKAGTTSAQTASDRLLLVLATLAQSGAALSAAELVQRTGLARSTVYRQLAYLKQWGFAQDSGEAYAPGPAGLQLGQGFDAVSPLVARTRAEMDWLAHQSGESVGLVVAVNDSVVCLDMIESSQALRCSFQKGRSVQLRRGASAKCLLAHQSRAQRHLWAQQLPAQADPRDATPAELDAIRAAGYARSSGEVDEGVWGVSAPLFGKRRRLLGALTLMAPAVRIQGREPQLIQMTMVAAARASRALQAT